MRMVLLALACGTGPEVQADASRPDAGPSASDERRSLAGLEAGRAAAAVQREALADQFGAAFAYGEGAGLDEDLSALVLRAKVLPVGLRDPFIDGAAHTWSPPAGVPLSVVAGKINRVVPPPWRSAFHNGVLMSWSISHAADPAAVVPRAEEYALVLGERPLDGVRIALQRVHGGDLVAAAALAARYPVDYQPALFEELGWRSGDDGADVCGIAERVPAAQRCAFVHGAVRGLTLRTDWAIQTASDDLGGAVVRASCGCAAAASRGVAWGLALRWGHRPQRAQTLARRLDRTVPEATVEAALRPLLNGPRDAPWVGIEG